MLNVFVDRYTVQPYKKIMQIYEFAVMPRMLYIIQKKTQLKGMLIMIYGSFVISKPNLIRWHFFESSRRDDSNKCHNIVLGDEKTKLYTFFNNEFLSVALASCMLYVISMCPAGSLGHRPWQEPLFTTIVGLLYMQ